MKYVVGQKLLTGRDMHIEKLNDVIEESTLFEILGYDGSKEEPYLISFEEGEISEQDKNQWIYVTKELIDDLQKKKELVNEYSEYILKKIRQYYDLDENDKSKDEKFNKLSSNEVFEIVCNWEGLSHYDETIKGWIDDIYGIDLNVIER